jgi:hypothetical protein
MCRMPLSWRSIVGGTRLSREISLGRGKPRQRSRTGGGFGPGMTASGWRLCERSAEGCRLVTTEDGLDHFGGAEGQSDPVRGGRRHEQEQRRGARPDPVAQPV